jgi:hypothetical protein
MRDKNSSRREFGRQLRVAATGTAYSFAAQMLEGCRVTPASFAFRLFRAAGKAGSRASEFRPTGHVAQAAGLPVSGIYHHLWLGNAGQFQAENSLTAGVVAGEVGELLGTQVHWDRLVALCGEFFGNRKVATENPTLVLVCKGHVTTRHAFAQNRYKAENLPPGDGGLTVLSPRRHNQVMLHFDGGWRGYRTGFELPQGMRTPAGRSDVALVRRRRLRAYRGHMGAELLAKDFIVQYSAADIDPTGEDMRTLWAGGYYPNSEPFRRLFNDRGYTDSTSVVFARVVGHPHAHYVHQVNLNFNLGLIRDRLAASEKSNPEELLDINTVVRPLDRLFDQYSDLRQVLEEKVFAKL